MADKDTVHAHVVVPVAPGRAFEMFVEQFGDWWPRDYTFARDKLALITIEPGEGGRCFERDMEGGETDWGRVVDWEPYERLTFQWLIAPDSTLEDSPENASLVEVRFTPADKGRTRVDLTHRDFIKHEDGWETYAEQMKSDYGWPLCLGKFAEFLQESSD